MRSVNTDHCTDLQENKMKKKKVHDVLVDNRKSKPSSKGKSNTGKVDRYLKHCRK